MEKTVKSPLLDHTDNDDKRESINYMSFPSNDDNDNRNEKTKNDGNTLDLLEESGSNVAVIFLSAKHALKMFVMAFPLVIMFSVLSYCISMLPYTNECYVNETSSKNTSDCLYYNTDVLFGTNSILKIIIYNVTATVFISLFLKSNRLLVRNLLTITIPLLTVAIGILSCLFILKIPIWYYFIDASISTVLFCAVTFLCFTNICLKQPGISMREMFVRIILPVLIGDGGYLFTLLLLNNRYKVADTVEKYLIRLVYLPVVIEIVLICQEFHYRVLKVSESPEQCDVRGRTGFVFLAQVSLGIVGRYMTITSGSLLNIIIFSCLIALKDMFLHRMSWLQCWISFKLKALFKIKDSESYSNFKDWFYEPKFREFRAHTLNNEFLNEASLAFMVPLLIIIFKKHRLLFRFDYSTLTDSSGDVDISLFLQQEAVQLFFLLLTFIAISFIEIKYNRLNLSKAAGLNNMTLLEIISRILIYFWGIFALLGSVMLLPNHTSCKKNDICTCSYHVDKSAYGCT